MIKRVYLFLVLCGWCGNLWGAYTIDKRQYVDASAWATSPYKYVLQMQKKTGGNPFCTANMIGNKIVTAKHCIDGQNVSDIVFVAYNGRKMCAMNNPRVGNYVDGKPATYTGDWAVLAPCAKDADFVKKNNLDFYGESIPVSVMVNKVSYIGGGALKIMSDEEIKAFHKAYYRFIYDIKKEKPNMSGDRYATVLSAIHEDDGVNLMSKTGQAFLKYMTRYGINPDIFRDTNRLKESVCKVNKDPNNYRLLHDLRCQSWGGDSGGGLYMVGYAKDIYGNAQRQAIFPSFVGLHTRGSRVVGGDGHANYGSGVDVTVKNFERYLDK